MFGFGKKKEAAEQPAAEIYVAPVSGEYLPLAEVSDPVFSQGVMGDGYAVDPTDGVICAPVSGEIALIQDTLHAFMIRTPNGGEVLVHIGIDTVDLGGEGFEGLAKVADKVDAGDPERYLAEAIEVFDQKSYDTEQTYLWGKLGLAFPYNEFRACWKLGGQPLVQRLGDKSYSWNGVARLIPDMIAAGLNGYAYACPDMIGGGEYGSFLNVDPTKFNQKLIVRSCQIHAMMPMMQFSVAPWRILSKENLDICIKYAKWHEQLGSYLIEQAKQSAKTGEPIVRSMEYVFPNQGFADCKDQYMLGDKYLVAPVITESDTRTVKLPKGTWRDDQGKKYKGGETYTLHVPLDRLPYFIINE